MMTGYGFPRFLARGLFGDYIVRNPHLPGYTADWNTLSKCYLYCQANSDQNYVNSLVWTIS